jgi:hypothetical protein
MKRRLIVSGVLVSLLAGVALAAQPESATPKSGGDQAADCAAMMAEQGITAEGQAEMRRFMESGQMAQAMTGMMAMARQMGGGDPMKGMVQMMQMMGSMGGMMGPGMMGPGSMGPGMMGPAAPGGHGPQQSPAR